MLQNSENNDTKAKKKVVVVNEGKGGWRKWLKTIVFLSFALFLGGIAAISIMIYSVKLDLPTIDSVDEYKPDLGTVIYADDGTKVAEFATEKRLIVAYEKLPRLLILAFIATEDQNFFYHFGADPAGILRAAIKNIQAGRIVEGASTITMQLARGLFLSRDKSFTRKFKEAILAVFELEWNLTKEEILWLYLNQIYLGHGAYGVQQAAHTYFGKNVWELSIEEMAVLAGLPQRPGRDSPFVNMEKAVKRRNHVLGRMLDEGYISKQEYETALAKPIILNEEPDPFLDYAPHFVEHVRKYLYDKYTGTEVLTGGMHVNTTLNVEAQVYAQQALYYGLRKLDHRQGFRGAYANVPPEKWDEFFANTRELYGDEPLQRDKLYYGLVTKIDDKKKRIRVRVGDVEAKMPFRWMRWAREPDPELFWMGDLIDKPSEALQEGDVILVHPTDKEGVQDRFDHRSKEPIDPNQLIWELEQEPKAQAALISKDPESGYTIAMVGGYDFEDTEFNRAIQACRQPGSAFKPIVYTAAIEKGWTVSTILLDSPIVDGEWKKKWKPQNYGENYLGEVCVQYALRNSINIPAIRTLDAVGISAVKDLAKRMGIRTDIQEDRSISLGSACVTPEDLVNVFAHFPNGGVKPDTVYVKTIIDRYGNIIEDNRVYYDITLDPAEKLAKMEEETAREQVRVIEEDSAFIMTWMLQQVIRAGTATAARALERPAGGKTGTTNDAYDAWFAGFTPHLVTAAWIGHDDNSRPLGRLETGGRTALPIWLDFMKRTLENAPVVEFPEPEGIHWLTIDDKTGRLAIEGANGHLTKAPFKEGTKPEETMRVDSLVNPDQIFKMDQIY